MTGQPDEERFDATVRKALEQVSAATRPAPDLADRILANARAGGPPVVSLAARRRASRWALPLLAAATVAALAIGGTVGATLLADDKPATPPSTTSPQPTPSTPPPSASPPTTSAPTSRSARATPPRTQSRQGGNQPALTVGQVMNATIDIPSWAAAGPIAVQFCVTQPITFHDGKADMPPGGPGNQDGYQLLGPPAIGDLTGDGAAEAVVVLFCGPHEPVAYRVLALRATAGGSVAVIGDVVTPVAEFVVGPKRRLGLPDGVTTRAGGVVAVHWTDAQGGSTAKTAATQTRDYRFVQGRFIQVGGPDLFPDLSADTAVSAREIVLTRDQRGVATGVLKLSVRNNGPQRTNSGTLLLIQVPGVRVTSVTDSRGRHYEFDRDTTRDIRVFLPNLAVDGVLDLRVGLTYTGTGTPRPARIDFFGSGQDYVPGNDTAVAAFRVV